MVESLMLFLFLRRKAGSMWIANATSNQALMVHVLNLFSLAWCTYGDSIEQVSDML